MAKRPGKQIAEATAEPPTKGGEAAEKIVKGNAEALTVSGNASRAAVQELTRAYQELATKNAKNLTAAMQALLGVRRRLNFTVKGPTGGLRVLRCPFIVGVFRRAILTPLWSGPLGADGWASRN